eukprot:g2613.t1
MEDKKLGKRAPTSERLVRLFEDGISAIPVKKSDDIFKQLETRALSTEEQDIIQKRVAHQQKLFKEYNNREQNRKVREIHVFTQVELTACWLAGWLQITELQNVCGDLTREEAILTLQKCDDNEDEAALQLTSDGSFLRELRQSHQQKKLACAEEEGHSSFVGKFTSRVKPTPKNSTCSNTANCVTVLDGLPATNKCKIEPILDLKWGKKSNRSTVYRYPIQPPRLEALKASFSLAGQCSRARCGSRRSSRLQGRVQELIRATDLMDVEGDNSSGEEFKVRPSRVTNTVGLGDRAISRSGYTCRGRVKQKAQKRVELLHVGELNLMNGWFNAGYIFPLKFKSRTSFRSSVMLNAICTHECEIVKGKYWPMPTFVVTASDRPDDPLIAKSCTGSWNLVLNRINREIERRRRAGENLPPPPKTAIAGPEYFGLVQEDSVSKIEALDPERRCAMYWAGKKEREIALRNLPLTKLANCGKKKRSKNGRVEKWNVDSDDEDDDGVVEDEGDDDDSGTECRINKWSSIDRSERYKRRCLKKGTSPAELEAESNPLPTLIDPVTLETVVAPAISPYGHVMGIATWRAYLMNSSVCPFTKKPLTIEQCTRITKHNLHKYKDRILHF